MTTLSILPVSHPANLLDIYPNQTAPQACFIALDLSTGRMSTQTNPEIGNAVPMDVWHGIVRRYDLPGGLLAETANWLMTDIASHAQTILDHAEVVWDGSNNVVRIHTPNCEPRLGCDCPGAVAERAIEAAIEAAIETMTEEDYVHLASAQDWYTFNSVDEYVARVQAGESIWEVAAFMEKEIEDTLSRLAAENNEYWVVEGIEEYLKDEVERAEERDDDAA